jgi:hypothetical protein
MVISLADGAPWHVYDSLCTVGDYSEGYFFPTWMAALSTDRASTILGVVAVDHFDM